MSFITHKILPPTTTADAFLDRRESFIDPFKDMFDSMFNEFAGEFFSPKGRENIKKYTFPKVDVYRTKDRLTVDAALPGYPRRVIAVEVDDSNRVLTIRSKWKDAADQNVGTSSIATVSTSGETTIRAEEPSLEKTYIFREIKRSSFERSITIPETYDLSTARTSFQDGLLTIQIDKVTPQEPVKKHVRTLKI